MLSYEELLEQHSAELRLSRLVGGRGGLSAIVRAGAELTGKVTALFDVHDRLIARAGPEGFGRASVPPVARSRAAVPAAAEAREPVVVPADPVAQLYRRQLLGEVFVDDAVVGWLVVLEHPTPLRAIDGFLAMRTAEHLGREFLVQQRIASVAWNARASLARQLLRGTCDHEDLRSSGEYLGIDISARRVLAYVLDRDREDVGRVAIVNYRANQLACSAADRAMQVHGGVGYTRHKPFEHIYRHHRRYRLTEGTDELQMRRIAADDFKSRRDATTR